MTYSIVARDADGTTFGVATASRYLAVGSSVPAVASGVGALVTQARTNVLYRERGLRSLRRGRSAARTVQLLVTQDPGRAHRQVAVVGPGEPAAWTGDACPPVAGHLVGEDCVAVGNLLAGDDVLPAAVEAFRATDGPLARRLLAALAAADAAGGDRRGRQSAALLVAGNDAMTALRTPDRTDLRVDDHVDPVGELARLLRLHEVLVLDPDPADARPLDGVVGRRAQAALARLGRTDGTLAERVAAWAADANLGHRVLPEPLVDGALLEVLEEEAATRVP